MKNNKQMFLHFFSDLNFHAIVLSFKNFTTFEYIEYIFLVKSWPQAYMK